MPASSAPPSSSAASAPSDAKALSMGTTTTVSGEARPAEDVTVDAAPKKKREADSISSEAAPASKMAGPAPIAPPAPAPIAAGADAGSAPRSSSAPSLPPSPTPSRIDRAQSDFDRASNALIEAGAECATLCKALASMQRSADALCNLSKDGAASDKRRCTDAQKKVDVATAKVKASCTC
jgi:hypothetical protein